MSGRSTGDQVVARIGFARRWLDRAKRQCTDGNLPRSVLTLVLTDAELHHALEAAGVPAMAQSRWMLPAALLLLGAALCWLRLLGLGQPTSRCLNSSISS